MKIITGKDWLQIAWKNPPKYWDFIPYSVVTVNNDTDEYKKIEANFLNSFANSGINHIRIQSIERVQHNSQYALYLISKDKKKKEKTPFHEVSLGT